MSRVGDRRAQHALELLARISLYCLDAVSIEREFLLLSSAVEVAGVVDAMGHESPVTPEHRITHRRKVIEDRYIQRHRGMDSVVIQHFQQAPEPDPVTVVAVRGAHPLGAGEAG